MFMKMRFSLSIGISSDRKIKSERIESDLAHSEKTLKELMDRIRGYEDALAAIETEFVELEKNRGIERASLEMARQDIENIQIRIQDMEDAIREMKKQGNNPGEGGCGL
ncbi:MAG: hypothetical protein MZV49_04765 [Rhodopseudomonas palustris]|nr:hypothetical protein [Rhodopseudomonas palustris]